MAKQTRTRTLADATTVNLTELNQGKFQLGVGRLTQVTIASRNAATGPFLANAIVEFDNQPANRLSLGDPEWIRGDTQYGHRDAWHWEGEIDVDRDDHLLFAVRNDTGGEIIWVGGWVIV